MGISVDSAPSQRAFCTGLGGVPYPVLADFHPKGDVSRLYDVYNDERGNSKRSIFIIDKKGFIRFKQLYTQSLPRAEDILAEVEKLG